jgi:hypothetical protein
MLYRLFLRHDVGTRMHAWYERRLVLRNVVTIDSFSLIIIFQSIPINWAVRTYLLEVKLSTGS